MNLRPYQTECIEAVEAAYQRGVKSVLCTLPTGTGKTVVFATMIRRRHEAGDLRPCMVVAHREELLHQAVEKLRAVAPDLRVGIECGSMGRAGKASPGCSVIVASVQTLAVSGTKRLGWLAGESDGMFAAQELGLLVVDEAHHSAANVYGRIIDRFVGPNTNVAGFTATPKRLDRRAIHGHERAAFEEVAYSYSIREAIDDGWLSDVRGYRVDGGADLSGVRKTGGDYNAADLARKVDAPERTDAALRHWQEVAHDRQTIVFCAGVEHAHHVAAAFRERGIIAESVDGKAGREERAEIIRRFRAGEVQVLSNCELFTEGFDVPEASCALLLRPTQSWSLYVQMVGRVTRLAPDKTDAVVIDVVDNCARHALATVPAILDLPPGLDLEGQSLARAARAMDEMGAKSAVLQKALPGSWSELQTLLKSVDLFAGIETPGELEGARLRWLSIPGGYQVDCGEGRYALLKEDQRGGWELRLTKYNPRVRARVLVHRCRPHEGPITDATRVAEQIILDYWPTAAGLAARIGEAHWHGEPPTPRQIGFLRQQKYPESVLAVLTKGQAAGLISQFIAAKQASR